MPKRNALQDNSETPRTKHSKHSSKQREIRINTGRHSELRNSSQGEVEDLKKIIESQLQKINDLQNKLENKKLANQHYKSLLLQQRLRMRSHQIGELLCSATGCEWSFGKDDQVRDHIRKQQDDEHQHLASYL
jgi:hypothetical protein